MNDIEYTKVSEQVDLNLREWLASYFDGASHTLSSGTNPVTFPAVELGFGVSHLSQPISGTSGAAITTIAEFDPEKSFLEGDGRSLCEDVNLSFIVRAKVGPTQRGNSAWACQQTEQLLHALLLSPTATRSLAQYGLYDVEPDGRRILPVTEYATRELKATARLQYHA